MRQRSWKSALSSSCMSSMSCGVALSMRHQPIANQPRANAIGIAAFADRGQHVAIDDRRVGGPDAAGLRIDDARELSGREIAVPAARAIGPRRRRQSVEADAARNGAGDRPADAARSCRRARSSAPECRGRRRRRAARRRCCARSGLREVRRREPARRARPSAARTRGRWRPSTRSAPRSSSAPAPSLTPRPCRNRFAERLERLRPVRASGS